MYFVPEKGRFYRWAVHVKSLHRYAGTLVCVALLSGTWFFVLNPWLVGLVQYEQAALNRAEQQKIEAYAAERGIKASNLHIHKTNREIEAIARSMAGNDQFAFVCDTAQKVGLQINAFAKETLRQAQDDRDLAKKAWRTKNYKSLSATGTLDQCRNFLAEVAHSSHMIQCKQLALQRADQGLFSLQCQLEFISLQS
jgi:hypothetical protein